MFYRLVIKCIERIKNFFLSQKNGDFKIFDILLELYKFFKTHPPENLEVIFLKFIKNY